MYIKKEVYNRILFATPKPPPETGGVLFQKNNIVSKVVFDKGLCEYGTYSPNIEKINSDIEKLAKRGYSFCGIFHSHFPNGERLSKEDVKYIERITMSTNDDVKLFFPVVLPREKIVSYCSYIKDDNVIIENDKVFII